MTTLGVDLEKSNTRGETVLVEIPEPVIPDFEVGEFGIVPSSPLRALGVLRAGLALARTAPCAIVQTGSSTARGSGASTPDRAFFPLLISAIQSAFPSMGIESAVQSSTEADFAAVTTPGVHGYNASQGSTRASDYLTDAERDKIAALSPRAIFHQVGGNDYFYGVDPADYKASIGSSIAYFKAHMTTPCVHILTHPHQLLSVADPVFPWEAYGTALRELAEADPDHVVFLDLSLAYRFAGIPGSDPLDLLGPDNVHLTDAGHALMFDLVRNGIQLPGPMSRTTPRAPHSKTIITSDSFSGAASSTIVGRRTDAIRGGTATDWLTSNTTDGFAIAGNMLTRGAGGSQFMAVAAPGYAAGVSARVMQKPSVDLGVWLVLGRSAMTSTESYILRIGQGFMRIERTEPSTTTVLNNGVPYLERDILGIHRDVTGLIWMTINGMKVGDAIVDRTYLTPGFCGVAESSLQAVTFALDDVVIEQPAPFVF